MGKGLQKVFRVQRTFPPTRDLCPSFSLNDDELAGRVRQMEKHSSTLFPLLHILFSLPATLSWIFGWKRKVRDARISNYLAKSLHWEDTSKRTHCQETTISSIGILAKKVFKKWKHHLDTRADSLHLVNFLALFNALRMQFHRLHLDNISTKYCFNSKKC